MATIKWVNESYSEDDAIRNLCKYIVADEKTKGYVSGRGLNDPYHAAEEMIAQQQIWGQDSGRRMKHLIVSFSDEEYVLPEEAMVIAYQISGQFFPPYQVLYGVHLDTDYRHIHFAINMVSLQDGRKFQQENQLANGMKESVKIDQYEL